MNKMLNFGAAILAAGTLAGCGGEDFSGAYRTDGAYGKQIVLNIAGDDAKIFLVSRSSAEISGLIEFEVDYKNGKLLLDAIKENVHLTFKRGADERGLECLNCNEGKLRLPAKWALLQPEPYDVNSMLEEQEEKRQAAIKEEEQRRAEAAKLAKFDGDWVAKRHFKDDSLLIMTISPQKGVRHWAFNYSSAAKQIEIDRKFEVDNNELVFPSNDSEMRYSLSKDGQKLSCTNCSAENYWLKADPIKVNDLAYTRNLAGNPQESRR
ncbi:hypothetical protein SAMN05216601_10871 [Ectopseudomonas composti]|uniref:Lipoprotein n=1 Tax=Ectopseudomonas composti TaxID=658457 RepID=A0A1I5P4Q1_9GAMM|nr:hypothetical protein [Pseudomonas composti]SFP29052.1 hypothetical protein SAMN05216601_10871 [Pseudomonas composti]